jgi:hypothetical protein
MNIIRIEIREKLLDDCLYLHTKQRPIILGEFIVMSGSFFALFLILETCIYADNSRRTDLAFSPPREAERNQRTKKI